MRKKAILMQGRNQVLEVGKKEVVKKRGRGGRGWEALKGANEVKECVGQEGGRKEAGGMERRKKAQRKGGG